MREPTTPTNTDQIDDALDAHMDELRGLVKDIIQDATDDIREERDLAQAHVDRLAALTTELRERNDYLRDRLYNGHTDPTDAPTTGIADMLDTTPHDCRLANIAQNGPSATNAKVYPVHERAWLTLRNIDTWGELVRLSNTDGGVGEGDWAIELRAPTVRTNLERERTESLSSTQTRRVFETIRDWGGECAVVPETLKVNGELRLRVRDGLLLSTVLATPTRQREGESQDSDASGRRGGPENDTLMQ